MMQSSDMKSDVHKTQSERNIGRSVRLKSDETSDETSGRRPDGNDRLNYIKNSPRCLPADLFPVSAPRGVFFSAVRFLRAASSCPSGHDTRLPSRGCRHFFCCRHHIAMTHLCGRSFVSSTWALTWKPHTETSRPRFMSRSARSTTCPGV